MSQISKFFPTCLWFLVQFLENTDKRNWIKKQNWFTYTTGSPAPCTLAVVPGEGNSRGEKSTQIRGSNITPSWPCQPANHQYFIWPSSVHTPNTM